DAALAERRRPRRPDAGAGLPDGDDLRAVGEPPQPQHRRIQPPPPSRAGRQCVAPRDPRSRGAEYELMKLTITAAIHARWGHRVDGLIHTHAWTLEATVDGDPDCDKD